MVIEATGLRSTPSIEPTAVEVVVSSQLKVIASGESLTVA
jgi:hypothetical protein